MFKMVESSDLEEKHCAMRKSFICCRTEFISA